MMNSHSIWKAINPIILIVGVLICFTNIGSADETVTIYTPNGTPVTATIKNNAESLSLIVAENEIEREQRHTSQFIGDSTQHFNCHGYAWHVAEGGIPVYLTNIADYWNDGSYSAWLGDTSEADKAVHGEMHSVLTTPQNPWMISKLGGRPLMRHTNGAPYVPDQFIYYRAARQPRVPPFAVTYGGEGTEEAKNMCITADGGVIVAGSTASFGSSGSDGWLLKLDRQGNNPAADSVRHMAGGWQRRYGSSKNDILTAVVQAYDYGYVAAGYTTSFSTNSTEDGWLMHLDREGGLGTCNYSPTGCWRTTYNSPNNHNDRFMALARWSEYTSGTFQDGYIAAGRTNLGGTKGYEAWVQKVDRTGITVWQTSYGSTANEMAYAIVPVEADGDSTTNDGFLVVGAVLEGTYDLFLLKLDAAGNVASTWPKRYGGSANDYAYAVQQTDDDQDGVADDGYIVAGSTTSFGAGQEDAWILKVDANGAILWQQTYGGSGSDVANAVLQTADGGYIVAGTTTSFGASDKDVWVFKLNTSGAVVWGNRHGGDADDQAAAMAQTVEGDLLVAGQTASYGAGGGEVFLLRMAADGSCRDCPPGASVTTEMLVNTPVYATPALTLTAANMSATSSSPALSSTATSSQSGYICGAPQTQNSYLLWTK